MPYVRVVLVALALMLPSGAWAQEAEPTATNQSIQNGVANQPSMNQLEPVKEDEEGGEALSNAAHNAATPQTDNMVLQSETTTGVVELYPKDPE